MTVEIDLFKHTEYSLYFFLKARRYTKLHASDTEQSDHANTESIQVINKAMIGLSTVLINY